MDTPLPPSPSLLRHLMAMLYDALLVLALIMVVIALALGVVVKLSHGAQQTVPPPLVWILVPLCPVGFYTAFWLTDGQTLGMQAWRIRLVGMDGAAPTLRQALLRCAGAALSFACAGLGYLWKFVDRRGLYWHDRLSGTRLELLPRKSRDRS